MNLREQFVEHLKQNIESKILVDINNNHENYINWLENKVKSSEEDKQNILKSFQIYRKMTYCTEEVLLLITKFNQTALGFIKQDDRNIMTSSSLKKWFEIHKKQPSTEEQIK